MEVRVIKTCHGFQRVLFLDGALVQVNDDQFHAALRESVQSRTSLTQPLERQPEINERLDYLDLSWWKRTQFTPSSR